jgi:hypothetical protein
MVIREAGARVSGSATAEKLMLNLLAGGAVSLIVGWFGLAGWLDAHHELEEQG